MSDAPAYAALPPGDGSGERPGRARLCLFASYSFAAWAWRSWEFAVALVLMNLHPNSMTLVSIYGLLDDGVRVFLGARVGRFIDRSERMRGAVSLYFYQNICIGASALSSAILLMSNMEPFNGMSQQVYWSLMGVAISLGALSSVGNSGIMIAVEKKMPRVLCGEDARALASCNAVFRRIDLTSLLLAPMVVGGLMTWAGPLAAVVALAAYCMAAWVPEVLLLRGAFASSTALRAPKHEPPPPPPAEPAQPGQQQAQQAQQAAGGGGGAAVAPRPGAAPARRSSGALATYLRQDVLLPQLALALLYLTVLSLGFLMTSYLKWTGMTEAEVSMWRAPGAVTGLAATLVFPAARARLGAATCAALGIALQFGCLASGASPLLASSALAGGLWPPGAAELVRPTVNQVRCLMGGVVASRFGLWFFDMAVTQLVQERVAQEEMGLVSGVQSSLQALLETLSFVASLAFPDPLDFLWLIIGSLCSVGSALVITFVFAGREWALGAAARRAAEETSVEQRQGLLEGGAEDA